MYVVDCGDCDERPNVDPAGTPERVVAVVVSLGMVVLVFTSVRVTSDVVVTVVDFKDLLVEVDVVARRSTEVVCCFERVLPSVEVVAVD